MTKWKINLLDGSFDKSHFQHINGDRSFYPKTSNTRKKIIQMKNRSRNKFKFM